MFIYVSYLQHRRGRTKELEETSPKETPPEDGDCCGLRAHSICDGVVESFGSRFVEGP